MTYVNKVYFWIFFFPFPLLFSFTPCVGPLSQNISSFLLHVSFCPLSILPYALVPFLDILSRFLCVIHIYTSLCLYMFTLQSRIGIQKEVLVFCIYQFGSLALILDWPDPSFSYKFHGFTVLPS